MCFFCFIRNLCKNTTMMNKKIWVILFLTGLSISCSNKDKSTKSTVSNKIDLSTEEIKFAPSEVLNAEAYNINASCLVDGNTWIVGYNRHIHSLDFIKLSTKEIFQTKLEKKGEASVLRPVSIYAHNLDSIWIYDQIGQLILMDNKGLIKQTENLNKQTGPSEKITINTNHAMYTSKLYYNQTRRSLFYIVQKDNSFYAKESPLDPKSPIKYYPLSSPYTTHKEVSSNFGNMDGVNATFTDNQILYNYPIESVFYVYNILTGENKLIESYSAYTQNTVKPLATAVNDYSKWERHGLENPHFYEVMYIPKYKMYMRLHLKETEFDKNKSVAELSDNRELYLTCWNESFQFLCEVMLPGHRYNYYTGWCGLYDGLLLYVNNTTSKDELNDLLKIDVVRPITK